MKGKGTEGKHQASGPSWPCLSREDFFLTQRLKCFYLKRLFTFQSPKKKKKAAAKLQAYICPRPRHRHSIITAQGNILSPLPELLG